MKEIDEIIIILGVHTPGKYLSAVPGSLREAMKLLSGLRIRKTLTGPAIFGSANEGGRLSSKADMNFFDRADSFDFSYGQIARYSVLGSKVIRQIPGLRIIEIETARGCRRKKGCSFCTEPLKHAFECRPKEDIIEEFRSFYELGIRDFRLGKQSCFYSYTDPVGLLEGIRQNFPDLRTLHIDNVDPSMVVNERGRKITESIVRNCTAGNVAAFGIESFDQNVIQANNLNSDPEKSIEAIRIINEAGSEKGDNGMPTFLPGINLLYGLEGESKKTNQENMLWLQKILDEKLLLRRINIRQVDIFEGTPLFERCKNKYIKKNKRFYWKWRNEVRQKIDYPMLKRLVPSGSVLKEVRTEVHDGNHTFARQVGTYPLIVGINRRTELGKFFDVRIVGHMLRSVTGEIIE